MKTENSRRVAKSRPVCMGLNTDVYKFPLDNFHLQYPSNIRIYLVFIYDFYYPQARML